MNLKFKSVLMLLAMAALSMTACKEEALEGGQNPGRTEEAGNYFYISAGVALPSASGTRSSTDEEGETNSDAKDSEGNEYEDDFEIGYDYENDVRTMILVIADKDNNYIAHSVVKSIDEAPSSNSRFDFVVNAEIKYEDLQKAYEKDGLLEKDQTVNVFAYCNYTARIYDLFEAYKKKIDAAATSGTEVSLKEWLDWNGEVVEPASPAGQTPSITNTIWAKRSFLMTNAEIFTFQFPKNIDAWDPFTDKSNPFKLTDNAVSENESNYDDATLTPIRVERAAARIDFRDGSGKEGDEANIYDLMITTRREIKDADGNDKDVAVATKNLFSVKLTRMALVNMSKEFYYIRRVSEDGTPSGDNFKYAGPEYPTGPRGNYVIDTDYKEKGEVEGITPATAANHFSFPLFETNGDYNYDREGWYVDDIKDVLKGTADTWSGSVDKRYKIWRYVTENTIPTVEQQKTIQSTGIVFKASIIEGKDINLGFDYDDAEDKDNFETSDPYVSSTVKEALAKSKTAEKGQSEDGGEGYNYPILYSFNNMLFGGIKDLVYAAGADGQGGELYNAVDKALRNWKYEGDLFKYAGTGTVELTVDIAYDIYKYREAKAEAEAEAEAGQEPFDEEAFYEEYCNTVKTTGYSRGTIDFLEEDSEKKMWPTIEENFIKHAPENGLTVYRASDEEDGEGWGYYCYYFYWNRHNDNLRSGKMGPMEFATVRNNVYKLSVTKIGGLGHTRRIDYDPKPIKPEDPDEDPLAYIQVQVEVLPWVVRVNDIEF